MKFNDHTPVVNAYSFDQEPDSMQPRSWHETILASNLNETAGPLARKRYRLGPCRDLRHRIDLPRDLTVTGDMFCERGHHPSESFRSLPRPLGSNECTCWLDGAGLGGMSLLDIHLSTPRRLTTMSLYGGHAAGEGSWLDRLST